MTVSVLPTLAGDGSAVTAGRTEFMGGALTLEVEPHSAAVLTHVPSAQRIGLSGGQVVWPEPTVKVET